MNWKELLFGRDMYHWEGWIFWLIFLISFFVLIYVMLHVKPPWV